MTFPEILAWVAGGLVTFVALVYLGARVATIAYFRSWREYEQAVWRRFKGEKL